MKFEILREIADYLPAVIFAKSRDGKFIYANREYERLFGVNREWLIGRTCYDLMPEDIAHICCGHDKIVLTREILQKFEENYPVKGEQRTYSSIKFPLRDDSGVVYGLAGISIDVTENKRKEEALTEANARLEALVNAIPDIVVFKDIECRHLLMNKAAENIMGMSSEETLGKRNEEVLPPEAAAMCQVSDEKALASREPVHAEESVVTKSGETIHIDTIKASIRDEQGKLMGLVTVSRDVTERKQAEEALRESRERFRDLIEATSDWVWEVDDKGVYTYVSPQVREILGYSPQEVLGKKPFSFMPPEEAERIAGMFQKIVTSQQPFHLVENVNLHKNGNRVIMETSGVPFFDDSGNLRGYRGMDRNITERKRFEEELQKAQKLESIGLLAGGIAHDFNNILTSVLGNIELAKMFLPEGEKAAKRLAVAEEAAARARGITQQLLTFAKGGAPIKQVASVSHLVQESVEFALRGSNVKSELSFPSDLWLVEVDESQMQQLINNLVLNAAQAMPEGGVLAVAAANESLPRDNGQGLPEGRYVRIEIKDQGSGIPEKIQGRIFDPYFTTKEHGSGLGLTISFSIAKRHGGTITVDSRPGKGSTFSILLPASEKRFIEPKAEEPEVVAGTGRILVMDDEEEVNAVAAEMLQHLGYRVERVRDGAEAVNAYRQALAANDSYDVVITDLTVAAGMGGKETARRLLAMDPQAKIIVSSGYGNDPVMSDYAEYGFKGVIPKPYRLADLSKTLKEVLGGKE